MNEHTERYIKYLDEIRDIQEQLAELVREAIQLEKTVLNKKIEAELAYSEINRKLNNDNLDPYERLKLNDERSILKLKLDAAIDAFYYVEEETYKITEKVKEFFLRHAQGHS